MYSVKVASLLNIDNTTCKIGNTLPMRSMQINEDRKIENEDERVFFYNTCPKYPT